MDSQEETISQAELELRAAGIAFERAPAIEAAGSLEEFAQRSWLRPGQVIKSLLLDIDGQRQALLLLPGDRSAAFAALRRHFGARSVRLADRTLVESVTGYRVGTVTPFGLALPGLSILLDETLLEEPLISIGIGRPGRHLRLSPRDLVVALKAIAGPFSRPA
ncbi:MAG: aminoacyl-tRNA deacylase [Dehalococcoidia bacterium]